MKTKTKVCTTNYVYQKENQVFLLDRANTVTKVYKPISFNWIPSKNYNKINLWFTVLLFFGLSLFTSCDKDNDVNTGSQTLISEIREVGGFTKLRSQGVFEVSIAQGDSQSVEITADDNIIGRVRTNVVNDELRLELSEGNYENITLRARITIEQLNGITNSGVGNIVASNVDSSNFSLVNSGDADITISGTSNNLDCFNEGAGDVNASSLLVNNADLEIRGSGSIEISCTDTLNAEINGSGDVLYRGNPTVDAAIRGSGVVRKVGD